MPPHWGFVRHYNGRLPVFYAHTHQDTQIVNMQVETEKLAKNKKPRNGARGVSKVKTGCNTCKIRHKKCDETKPECSQCISTGRKCDFFLASKTPFGAGFGNDELQRRPANNITNLIQRASLGSFGISAIKEYEALYIQSYQNFVDREFAATFEIVLWQRVILRMASIEQYVRNALVAIGALVNHRSSFVTHRQLHERNYSLIQYNSAIVGLTEQMDNSIHGQELAILGAFLFAAFEIIRGHEDRARMHMRSAFTILKSFPWSVNQNKSLESPSCQNGLQVGDIGHANSPSTSDVLALFNAFSRLDPQAGSFNSLHNLTSSEMPRLPPKFSSLVQARECLLSITNAMAAFFSRTTPRSKVLPYSPLPDPMVKSLSVVQDALDTWHRHFSKLTSHVRATDIRNTAIIQVLLIHHGVAQIQASTHFFRDESAFDPHVPQFERIVSLAKAARQADNVRASTIEAGPCFIFDIGMVQPMFYVAQKCRDGAVRRAAIDVMQEVRGKKVHDVQLQAQVAKWIVSVEEEELSLGGGDVAEHKRLHDIDLDFSSHAGSCQATAWRRTMDGNREDVTAVVCPASPSKHADLVVLS